MATKQISSIKMRHQRIRKKVAGTPEEGKTVQ
jgi:hypothetical protein